MSSTASKHKPQLICNCIVLRGQPSPTILYTDSLPLPYFTQTAFPYHTLHRQPSPTILYTDSLPLPYFTQTAFPYHTLHRQPIPITGIAQTVCCTVLDD